MEPVVPDVTQLKALSHPLRLRVLGLLRTHGPATASQVARRLGLNSGATSYHLRQLALHGFVEEAVDLGTRRDRWWQATTQMTSVRVDESAGDEGRDAEDAFHQLAVSSAVGRIQEAVARRGAEEQAWREVTSISDMQVPVTAEQAKEIQSRFESLIWEVLDEHPPSAGPVGEGKRRYQVVVASFPLKDEPGWESDEDGG